jgi:D-glycero-D-manno-heptose 1,7-bisphosphate phosphatase
VSAAWSGSPADGPLTFQAQECVRRAQGRPAVFLDRDGTVNEAVPDPVTGLAESPLSAAEVRLLPGAAHAVRALSQAGFTVVFVTNQPAAAKGKVDVNTLVAVHERVLVLLAELGAEVESSRVCLHHPDGVVAGLSGRCECRKPAPGMLLEAAAELGAPMERSWMVGDTDADVGAGRAAGCSTMLLRYPPSAHKRAASEREFAVTDIDAAARKLLGERPSAGDDAWSCASPCA